MKEVIICEKLDISPPGPREKIMHFEELLRQHPEAGFGDQEDCPLTHTFAEGMYVREIFIPAGKVIVGKIHKHSHPNFLLKGKVSVYTEFGGIEHLEAPQSIISKAGTKRVVVTHEDTVWVTVHLNPNEHRDLNKIEDEVIAKDYDDYQIENEEKKWLG